MKVFSLSNRFYYREFPDLKNTVLHDLDVFHWKMEAWQRDGILLKKNNKLTLEHFANALRFREEQKKEM